MGSSEFMADYQLLCLLFFNTVVRFQALVNMERFTQTTFDMDKATGLYEIAGLPEYQTRERATLYNMVAQFFL
jgi:hypothetical protein